MSLDQKASKIKVNDGGNWDWIINGLINHLGKDHMLEAITRDAVKYVEKGLPEHLNQRILDKFEFPLLF